MSSTLTKFFYSIPINTILVQTRNFLITYLKYLTAATSELSERFPEGRISTTGIDLQETSGVYHPLTFFFSRYNALESQFDAALQRREYRRLQNTINQIKQ